MNIYLGTKPGNIKDFSAQGAMRLLGENGQPVCKPVGSIVPEQPWELEETTRGAEFRAAETERLVFDGRPLGSEDVVLGCENGICTLVWNADPEKCIYTDPAVVVARTIHGTFYGTSFGIQAPTWAVLETKEIIRKGLAGLPGGDRDMTVGKVIAKRHGCDHANWHKFLTGGRYDRQAILTQAFYALLCQIRAPG